MAGLVSWLIATVYPVRQSRDNRYMLPLPNYCHVVLSEEMIEDRPVFVVGDVHGCLDELQDLLELASARHKNPFVVFVGDIINKGPHNMEVLRLVQQMIHKGQAAAVRGNHEESILRELWAMFDNKQYKLPERYNWLLDMTTQDFDFLQELPYTISIPSQGALVVHAGLVPGYTLEGQSLESLTHMRNIVHEDFFSGRGLHATSKIDQGEAWSDLWPGPEHVYFGHDARRGLQKWPKATGLDTGCLYGNKLTGVFIGEVQEFLSVNAKKVYVEP